jgi:hypothetical protein
LASPSSNKDEALEAVIRAGLDPAEIRWEGAPKVIWKNIIDACIRRNLLPNLIKVAKENFPNEREALEVIERQLQQPPAAQPRGKASKWNRSQPDLPEPDHTSAMFSGQRGAVSLRVLRPCSSMCYVAAFNKGNGFPRGVR